MKYDVTVLVDTTTEEEPTYVKIDFSVRASDDVQARERGRRKFTRLHKNKGEFIWLIISPKHSVYRM